MMMNKNGIINKTGNISKNLFISSISAARGDISGEIDLNWDAVDEADCYVIEFKELSGRSKWNLVDITNESKYTIRGLKNRKPYLFRVAAVDANKQGPWSDTVEKSI